MPVYETRLVRRETVAQGTMAFHLEKPPGWRHEAGQNLTLTLPDPPETDGAGNARTFTIASAPHEPELMVATRMRNTAFKRVLKTAAIGTSLTVDGPNGMLLLHEEAARPAAFLSGGIGITPFLSMARHAAKQRLPIRLYLFYSNRRPEDAAFLGELRALEQANPNYRLVATMTEPGKSSLPWQGETGFIGRELLERHLPDLRSPVYYLAGPPAMTAAMQAMLEGIGVPADAVRSEEFYGY